MSIDVNTEADSSSAQSADVTPPSSSAPDANTENSSASEVVKPASMLEAVSEALAKPDETQQQAKEAPQSTEGQEKSGEKEANTEKPPSLDPKAYENMPFGKHPRFRQVLKHTRDLEERLKGFEAREQEFGAKEKVVQDFESFRTAVQEADLSSEDVAQAFLIASLIKSDPGKALELITPIVENLTVLTGNRLPADLQAKVDQGLIDEDTALHVSRERANLQLATKQSERTVERTVQSQQSNHINAVRTAVITWEDQWKQSDPDYPKKQPFVEAEVRQMIAMKGAPRSPEEAVQMSKDARRAVEDRLKAMMPAKPSVRTVTGASGTATNGAQPVPKNMLEAVELGLARSRA